MRVPGYKLPGGALTDSQVREELLAAPVFIGLVTEASLSSAYVLVELGVRWEQVKRSFPSWRQGFRRRCWKGQSQTSMR
jgi:hypothetical protein